MKEMELLWETVLSVAVEGERYPHYRPWRPMGDVDARVHIFTAMALGWGRVASPTLGRLYPLGNPWYSFYRRLSGPQDQSGHGVKKNLRHPGSNPGRPAWSQAPCCLSHLDHSSRREKTFLLLMKGTVCRENSDSLISSLYLLTKLFCHLSKWCFYTPYQLVSVG